METTNFFSEIKTISTVLHVLSAVAGMGAALMGDYLFNFYSAERKLEESQIKTLSALSRIVWWGLLAIVISGAFLFLSDPERYMASDKFLAKITILGVLVINGFFLSKKIWPEVIKAGFFTELDRRVWRKLAFVCGAISVLSWASVLALGVLDKSPTSYINLIGIYLGVLLVAIPIALTLEKKKFN